MLSAGCRYGLFAALYLAQNGGVPAYVSVRKISGALNIPQSYLAKVLRQLTESGILKSLRGPHGGVALARSPDEIVLMDIIEMLDERSTFKVCLIGLPECASPVSCLLSERWACAYTCAQTVLGTTTLTEAVRCLSRAGVPWLPLETDTR